MDWIVAPHSPSLPAFWPLVRSAHPDAVTVTANSGIEVFRPDYYFLWDDAACRNGRWHRAARTARAAGTKLVTVAKPPELLRARGLDHFDIYLEVKPAEYIKNYIPGQYVGCGFSRLYCLQFALENRASRIILLGMEGYQKEEYIKTVGGFVRSAIRLCPNVQFDVCGELNYDLPDTPNLRRFAIPEMIAA